MTMAAARFSFARSLLLLAALGGLLATTACAARLAPPTEGGRTWRAVTSGPVTVYTDLSERKAEKLARDYHRRFRALMTVSFSCAEVNDQPPPVEATVFASRSDFEVAANMEDVAALARSFGSLQRGRPPTVTFSAGRRIGQSVRTTGRKERLFQHEIAHRLTASCFSNLPRWLIEGLAELVETTYIVDGAVRVGQSAWAFSERFQISEANGVSVQIVPRRKAPSVAELRALNQSTFYAGHWTAKKMHYAGSWALTHMLAFGDEELRAPFRRYLNLLRRGELSEEAAWDRAFGAFDIGARYEAYIDAQRFSTFDVPFEDVQASATSHELSDARTREVLARAMDWGDPKWAERAKATLEGARKGAAAEIALAQLALADLAFSRGDRDGARHHVEQAFAATPKAPRVLAAYLTLLMTRDEATSETAEHVYRSLVAANAQSANAHLALGEYELLKGRVDASIDRLVRALERHPACWECMEVLGNASLVRSDAPSAVDLFLRAYNLVPESWTQPRERLLAKLAIARQIAADPDRQRPEPPRHFHSPEAAN